MGLSRFKKGVYGVFVLFLATSCQSDTDAKYKTEQGYALGTTYTIKYEVPGKDYSLKNEIEEIFNEVNASLSTYLPSSDISRINHGDTTIVVDALFEEVYLKAKEVWRSSGGKFDPTVGVLVNALGFGPETTIEKVNDKTIDSLLPLVGFNKIFIADDKRVVKSHPDIFIDFNALAKGYTIDLIGRMFDEKGIENYLIEVGGEILTKGKNTQKIKNWVVAIDSPLQGQDQRVLMAKVKLENQAMATSGNYRKYKIDEETGEHYVHTIDPLTGRSVKTNVMSVSVVAPTCMEADAYATAFMVMDLDSSKAVLKRKPHLEAFIITGAENGDLQEFKTEGFKKLILE